MDSDDIQRLGFNIGAVERDTGLAKDTLRVWERRYGFPTPMRDANGERVYPADQVNTLRLIARLIARGHRPGRIIGQPHAALEALLGAGGGAATEDPALTRYLELIRTHQAAALRQTLIQTLHGRGLSAFISEVVVPLNVAIGEAWVRGELQVFEEHLYTEQIQGILRAAAAGLQGQGGAPRILLTSLPEEPHALGLLMVEAMLGLQGASCIALGTQTPADEIARASLAHGVDIVALSFSAAFNPRQAQSGLTTLRQMLPGHVELWAGGSGLASLSQMPQGTERLGRLEDLPARLSRWRNEHGDV
jgi:MerR family transcriptional regulator, light-induced transcriptional regulator